MSDPVFRRCLRGFNLIEFLVVIAIIGLPFALIVPRMIDMGDRRPEPLSMVLRIDPDQKQTTVIRKHDLFVVVNEAGEDSSSQLVYQVESFEHDDDGECVRLLAITDLSGRHHSFARIYMEKAVRAGEVVLLKPGRP